MANRITDRTAVKHTRLIFSPLTWGCQLECLTPDSPATQTYSSAADEYSPDRECSPTAIRPTLNIVDPDGIYEDGIRNDLLAKSYHQWYVDGEEIENVWTESVTDEDGTITETNDYLVASSANNYLGTGESQYNGTIRIYKNMPVGDGVSLTYRGTFNDGRTGYNQDVASDTMALVTMDQGVDEVGVVVSQTEVLWNPINDKHLLYDYLTGLGISADSDYNDGAQYDKEIDVRMTVAGVPLDEVTDGYTLKIIDHATGEEVDDDAITWNYPTLSVDMRMVDDFSLEAQLIYDATGNILASQKIDFYYEMPDADSLDILYKADIPVALAGSDWGNTAIITLNGQKVEYPELYYAIDWYVRSRVLSDGAYTYGDKTLIGHGETIEGVSIADELGLDASSSETAWCEVSFSASQRAACAILTDDSGDYLTDDGGNLLIA